MRRATLTLLLSALGSALIGAAWAQNWPSAAETVTLIKQADAKLGKLELQGEVATYSRDDLWEYINGDAERYFAYEYQWTVAATFQEPRSKVKIAADVYRFKSDLDAFGAYSMDRDARTPGSAIALGGEASVVTAYWAGNQLHVWRGPLYVRIVPGTLKDTLKPLVLELGEALVEGLPSMQKTPAIFKIPPQRGLIIESVKFQRRNVLGQSILKNALLATYGKRKPGNKLETDMELLLFDAVNKAGAKSLYDALKKHLSKGGSARNIAALGQAALVMRHRRHGQTYAMRQGRYVVMLRKVRSTQAGEAMLRQIGKNVRLLKNR